ncbi:MAG: MG2 domain-containing protein [Planctomycetota bacterium]
MNEDPKNHFSAEERDRLEQELLELHFGCHEDPTALQARIAAEPAVRALQQEVLAQAQLLEAAAKPELPRLDLRPAPTVARPWPLRVLRSPMGRLLAVAAAAVLVVLGFFADMAFANGRLQGFQQDHLHLTVSAPRAVPAGAPWSIAVEAANLAGEASECRLRWQAFDEQGTQLAASEQATQSGRAVLAMPADLRAVRRVEVVGLHGGDEVRQVLELSQAPAGPLVHVSTDRPVYRPGEPVFVSVAVLDRVTLLPVPDGRNLQVQLKDGKGAIVAQEWTQPTQGGAGATLVVPPQSAGGTHTVEVAAADGSLPTETAEVTVRSFQQPRLDKQIVLDRKTYAPGARGSALVTATRMGEGVASGAAAVGKLVIDGSEVWSDRIILDDRGAARFSFTVPRQIEQGAGRFVATITDGGVVETEVRPFVVPTGKVLCAVFPEGGELIAGVANGVYLECSDPLGRPIESVGEVVDDRGERVAKFVTVHQGRVRIEFTPRAGRAYSVRLAGRTETTAMPDVKETGIALQAVDEESPAAAPLRLEVAGRGEGPWLLGVFCRGVLVGQATLRPDDRGELRTEAAVELPPHAQGVLRATVFDRNLQPIAERLVRRAAEHRVAIALDAEHATVAPGASQKVAVRTTDEHGAPVSALVALTVTDRAAVSLGSEPRVGLADDAALFADVERVEDLGDFFLAGEHGARNADLLLGTRGWRRFVWRNDDRARTAIAAHKPWSDGVLAREGFSQTPQVLSNLQAARAGGEHLAAAAWRAGRTFRSVAFAAGLVLGVALLVELLLKGLLAASSGVRVTTATAAAGALVLALFVVPGAFGARAEAPAAAAADFAVLAETGIAQEQLFLKNAMPMPQDPMAPEADIELKKRLWAAEPAAAVDNLRVMLPIAVGRGGGGGDAELRERQQLAGFLFLGAGGWDERDVRAAAARDYRYLPATRVSRQYAHEHVATPDRTDFAATIAWFPTLLTDASGNASIAFATSDAVTTWQIDADAHAVAGTGRVGTARAEFTAQLPFALDVKLPDEMSAGELLALPIAAIATGLPDDHAALRVEVGGDLGIVGDAPTAIPLQNGRGRALVQVTANATAGESTGTLTIVATVGGYTDRLAHTIRIAPRGFPHRRSVGGSVAAGKPATFVVVVPEAAVPGSGHAIVKVFPSPLTGLVEGLEGLLQEPCGCFEQASSSNYPNTLVLSLLDATGDDAPAIAARARDLLPRGYARITGYECKEKGYEWFGGDPGHEALTAYGLLEFADMAKVYDVDAGMVDRTKAWLLARRTGKGGYERNSRALDSFGAAPPAITDAYVTYALLQSGVPAEQLKAEVDALVARLDTKDGYELALIACALHLARRPEESAARQRLAVLQQADGSLRGESSITRSGGQDLVVETTGFAVLAWLVDPAFTANVRSAAEFLHKARGGSGRFGATQATIVALRALCAYAAQNRGMKSGGTLRVREGERVLAERAFTAGDNAAIVFELWDALPPGQHELQIEAVGTNPETVLPFACDIAYHAEQPADDPNGVVTVAAALRRTQVTEGDTVALDVTVRNRTGEGQPMAIAIVGLPAGLELPTRVLDDLKKAEAFAFWELKGRELALYWRDLEPEATKKVSLDLIARIPGTSRGPASRSYLYYTPDSKRWAAPVEIEVSAR